MKSNTYINIIITNYEKKTKKSITFLKINLKLPA